MTLIEVDIENKMDKPINTNNTLKPELMSSDSTNTTV